ncbi:MAG: DUF3127 domain-containing protein [Saprospiraceae bacterium]|nr:DUF3127 domain-containing protein [Saprospiraceae bacterium]
MNFEIEGTLHKVFDLESKTASFQTREFVITTEGTYPQFVKFQAVQDRTGIVEGLKEGDKIKVFFDIRGREWQGKYFTNLNAWKIEKVNKAVSAPDDNQGFPPTNFEPFNEPANGNFNDYGDLPF